MRDAERNGMETGGGYTLGRVLVWLVAAIAVVIVGWALRAMASVMLPVIFALFLTLLVAPLDEAVSRRLGNSFRWLGHVAAMSAILLVLVAAVASIWVAAQQVVARFSSGNGGLGAMLSDLAGGTGAGGSEGAGATDAATLFDRLAEAVTGAGGAAGSALQDWATGFATTVLSAAGTTAAAAVLVFFFTLLMLIEAPRWRNKIEEILRPHAQRNVHESTLVIASKLRRYVLARAVLGLITAVLYAVWLWLFGIDLLLVWSLIVFVLNFIPTIGSLIGGILPVLYAFMLKDFGTAVAVGAGILVIEQVMGNFVDPKVQGRQVSVSPLVVLIVLLLWGWIWGIAGAIVAVPITIAMVTIFAHIGPLRPFALLLSRERTFEDLDAAATHPGG